MTKIYTKTGDTGETTLLGGKRVKKSCMEMVAIGEVDELNAAVGFLIGLLADDQSVEVVKEKLTSVQHTLFTVGANLAAAQTKLVKVPELKEENIKELEDWIDAMETELPELTQFILPGGAPASAQSFIARAICRRTERQVVGFAEKYPRLNPVIQQYLNRLSDALFVVGRWINRQVGIEEVTWKK